MDAGEGGEALSGADLVDSQEGSRRRVKLLMKLQGGEKLSSRADGDEEEEEEVARLDALEEMLADLSGRVCRSDQQSTALWDGRKAVLDVAALRRGSTMPSHVGHTREGEGRKEKKKEEEEVMLWPEEALFMLERTKIALAGAEGQPPMSLSEAYRLLLGNGCGLSISEYRVYSRLSRLGYRLLRHRSIHRPRLEASEVGILPDRREKGAQGGDDEGRKTLSEGPLESLWTSSVIPMIQPREALSVGVVFSKIALGQAGHFDKEGGVDVDTNLKVSYDVYAPSVTLRKAAPRLPNYRVAVVDGGGVVATQQQINRICMEFNDKVPLLLAVDDSGIITFYCLSQVSLPTEITMG